MDKRWAQAPQRRDQLALFPQSVDDAVAADHPIRALDAWLDTVDWTPWERHYAGHLGQPPLHPKLMAGCILYGLMRHIRSSRDLEDATRERLDFIWFLEGRRIDHSTFAKFRTAFGPELKDLNRQISRAVCAHYEEALLALILDGTRIRANSGRHGARTAEGLGRLIDACTAALENRLAALAVADGEVTAGAEGGEGPLEETDASALQAQAEALEAELERYRNALAVAQERDAAKAKQGGKKRPVRVPVTDPDSSILPNKEGGFAPNYTPVVAVDEASGAIVEGDVVTGADEGGSVQPLVEASESGQGQRPERVMADGNFAAGHALAYLEERGVEAYMPIAGEDFRPSNPAHRPDLSEPVPEEQRDALPRTGKYLGRASFVFDQATEQYYCPMGKCLVRTRRGTHPSGIPFVQYACPGRDGCPLASECIKADAARRTVSRDPYQPLREAVARHMATPAAQAYYRKRAPIVEGVFGIIKHIMQVRQFLLRGLAKVRIEWDWICGAFNLKKLLKFLKPASLHGPTSPFSPPTAHRTPLNASSSTQKPHLLLWRLLNPKPLVTLITPRAS